MWMKRSGFELRMKLGTEKKRMNRFWQFGYFHKPAVGRSARENHPCFFYLPYIFRTYFVSMTVPFANFICFVSIFGDTPLFQFCWISPESHGSAIPTFSQHFFLFRHYIYNDVRGFRVYFCGICIFPTHDVSTKL